MSTHQPSWLNKFNARKRLLISMVVGVVCFFLMPSHWSLSFRLISVWDMAISLFLLLAWLLISHATSAETNRHVDSQDQSGNVILILVIIAACASLFAIGSLIGNNKNIPALQMTLHAILSGIAIACSWLFIHAMFAFHYAHRYYRNSEDHVTDMRGLIFPHEKEPNYLDFAYFSFVIGMTAQVSDVQISSHAMRRLVMVHGLLSFAFNVVILAMAVNIISRVT